MVSRVAELPAGDTTRLTIAPKGEYPQNVDPQVLENLLEEFKDLFSGFLLGLALDRGVQLSLSVLR